MTTMWRWWRLHPLRWSTADVPAVWGVAPPATGRPPSPTSLQPTTPPQPLTNQKLYLFWIFNFRFSFEDIYLRFFLVCFGFVFHFLKCKQQQQQNTRHAGDENCNRQHQLLPTVMTGHILDAFGSNLPKNQKKKGENKINIKKLHVQKRKSLNKLSRNVLWHYGSSFW